MSFDAAPRRSLDAAADRIVIERGPKRTAIRLPRFGVAALGLIVLALVVWSAASAAFILFHDTVVAELRRGARATSTGYEAQIATLKNEIERVRTRGLVEKAGVHGRLEELGLRQAAIEKRQSRLSEIAEAGAGDAAAARDPAFTYSVKPSPVGQDAVDIPVTPDPLKSSALETAERVAAALDVIDARQARALEGFAARTGERIRTLARVYDAAGVKRPSETGARGGPFEPFPQKASTFEARIDQIAAERALAKTLERGLNQVPIRTPAPGASLSSGFGVRLDPFLGRPAFHAGVDFESDAGELVRATAGGRVISAGWSGGYGNMVEVDHGGGLTTRFGHLSAIAVREGEEVKIGSALGRVGSTGRSTGPHLHYETRVDGASVNPIRFLNAGRLLAAR